ncbi:MAG TPA: hypothetical protein VLQ45_23220 [Thermoanaerobaculia bacterium]|nr:hypothetical protein [Thermoanaerobaculia bacterium]
MKLAMLDLMGGRVVHLHEKRLGALGGKAERQRVEARANDKDLGGSLGQGRPGLIVEKALAKPYVQRHARDRLPLQELDIPAEPRIARPRDMPWLEHTGC